MYRGRIATYFLLCVFVVSVSVSVAWAQTAAPASTAASSGESDDANRGCPAPDKTHRYDATKGRTWVVIEIVAGGEGGAYTVTNLYGKVCEDKAKSGNGLLAVGKCVAQNTCHATAYMDQDGKLQDIKEGDTKIDTAPPKEGSKPSTDTTNSQTSPAPETPTKPPTNNYSDPAGAGPTAPSNASKFTPESWQDRLKQIENISCDNCTRWDGTKPDIIQNTPDYSTPGGYSPWVRDDSNPFDNIRPADNEIPSDPGTSPTAPEGGNYISYTPPSGTTFAGAPDLPTEVPRTDTFQDPTPTPEIPQSTFKLPTNTITDIGLGVPPPQVPLIPSGNTPNFYIPPTENPPAWTSPIAWQPSPWPDTPPSDTPKTDINKQLDGIANTPDQVTNTPTNSPIFNQPSDNGTLANPTFPDEKQPLKDFVPIAGVAHDPGTPAIWHIGSSNPHVDWTQACTSVGCAVTIAGPDLIKEFWPTQAQVIQDELDRKEYLASQTKDDLAPVEVQKKDEILAAAPTAQETFTQSANCNNSDWSCWAKNVGTSFMNGSLFSMSANAEPSAELIQKAVKGEPITGEATVYNPNRPGERSGGQSLARGGVYNPNNYEAAFQTDIARATGCGIGGSAGTTCYALVSYGDSNLIVKINDNGPLRDGRIIDLNQKSMDYFTGEVNSNAKLSDVQVQRLDGVYTPGPVDAATLALITNKEPQPAPENPGSDANLQLADGASDPRRLLSPDIVPPEATPRTNEITRGRSVESVHDINFAGLSTLKAVEVGSPLPDITPKYHELIPTAAWIPDAASRSGEDVTAQGEQAARQDEQASQLADRLAQADEETAKFERDVQTANDQSALLAQNTETEAQLAQDAAEARAAQIAKDQNDLIAKNDSTDAEIAQDATRAQLAKDQAALIAKNDEAAAAIERQQIADQAVLKAIQKEQVAAQSAVDAAQKRLDEAKNDATLTELKGGNPCTDTGFVQCPTTAAERQLAAAQKNLQTVNSNYEQCASGKCPEAIVAAQAQAEKGQGGTSAVFKAAETSFAADMNKRIEALKEGSPIMAPVHAAYALSDGLGYLATHGPRTLLEGTAVGEYLGFRAAPEEAIANAANPGRDLEEKIIAGRDVALLTVPVAADLSIGSKGLQSLSGWTQGASSAERAGVEVAAGREVFETAPSRSAANDNLPLNNPQEGRIAVGSDIIPGEGSSGGASRGGAVETRIDGDVLPARIANDNASVPPQTREVVIPDNAPVVKIPDAEPKNLPGSEIGGQSRDIIGEQTPAIIEPVEPAVVRAEVSPNNLSATEKDLANFRQALAETEARRINNVPAADTPAPGSTARTLNDLDNALAKDAQANVEPAQKNAVGPVDSSLRSPDALRETTVRQRLSDAWENTKNYFGIGKAANPADTSGVKSIPDYIVDSQGNARITNDSIPRSGEILAPEVRSGGGAAEPEAVTIEGTVNNSRIVTNEPSPSDFTATRGEPTGNNAPTPKIDSAEPVAPSSPISAAERPVPLAPESTQPTLDNLVAEKARSAWESTKQTVKEWFTFGKADVPEAAVGEPKTIPSNSVVEVDSAGNATIVRDTTALPGQQVPSGAVVEVDSAGIARVVSDTSPKPAGLLPAPAETTAGGVVPTDMVKQVWDKGVSASLGTLGLSRLTPSSEGDKPFSLNGVQNPNSSVHMDIDGILNFGQTSEVGKADGSSSGAQATDNVPAASAEGATKSNTTITNTSPTGAPSEKSSAAPATGGTAKTNGIGSDYVAAGGRDSVPSTGKVGGIGSDAVASKKQNEATSPPAGTNKTPAGSERTPQGSTEQPGDSGLGISGSRIMSAIGSFLGGFLPSFLKNNSSNGASAPPTTTSPAPTDTPTAKPITPSVAFISNPPAVKSGDTVRLSWAAVGATECTITGDDKDKTQITKGSYQDSFTTKALATTTVFSISCKGAGGTASGQVTVTVK